MADIKPEPEALGDCLLHLAHHGMAQECWRVVIDHYVRFVGDQPGQGDLTDLRPEAVNSYKATYERALLNAIRNEATHA